MTTQTHTTMADRNLDAGLAHTVSEVTRTDTKAGLILTLDGLLVAGLGLIAKGLHGLALVLAVVGAAAVVVGVVLALMVIRPRVAPRTSTDRSSFVYWATAEQADIEA
ncbi:Pycsar system effector family protein, partial [Streptomyces sp. NPDC002138]|uniref:Pycsar system effector family protein n=1 Tax=Streptomyces sp. NPDC002138 TaxID=3154410 RepID=UPI00332DC6E0